MSAGRALVFPPFPYVGVVSYGRYLFHVPLRAATLPMLAPMAAGVPQQAAHLLCAIVLGALALLCAPRPSWGWRIWQLTRHADRWKLD